MINKDVELIERKEKYLFLISLIISVIICGFMNLSSIAIYDVGDGVQHYLISKYSWKHPILFLDLWGKPLFTFFSSFFSQFGWNGIKIFQLLCGFLSSIIAYKIAKKLNYPKFYYIIPFLILFSPIYFAVINSGLTENFFSLMLLICIWLFICKKHLLGVLFFSFLPYVRIEGFFLFPLVIIYLFLKKKISLIPLLFVGTIIITIIGLPHYKSLLWIIEKNYKVGEDYGIKGSFFHYFINYDKIFGKWHTYILLLSLIWQLLRITMKKKDEFLLENIFFLFGSSALIFIAHSLFYSVPGINSNLGMFRFMAMIIPLTSILSLRFFEIFSTKKLKNVLLFFSIIFIILLTRQPITARVYPYNPSDEELVIRQAVPFIEKLNITHRKIYFYHPLFPLLLNFDPFSDNANIIYKEVRLEDTILTPLGSIILWDSHFCPLEGGLPFEKVKKLSGYKLLKKYKFFSTPFFVAIFERRNDKTEEITQEEIVFDNTSSNNLERITYINNFEKPFEHEMVSSEYYYSPTNSINFSKKEFGPILFELTKKEINGITLEFKVLPLEKLTDVKIVFHITDTNNNTKFWKGHNLPDTLKLNAWSHVEFYEYLKYKLSEKEKLTIYLWNYGKKSFFVDDFKINCFIKKKHKNLKN